MSKSSFLKGMSLVINLFPQRGDVLLSSYSDEEAFKRDLEQVGDDMRFAIKAVEQRDESLFTHTDSFHDENDGG